VEDSARTPHNFFQMAVAMMASTCTTCYAIQEDMPIILVLLRELAEYEKELSSCKTTNQMLLYTLSFPVADAAPARVDLW
jgi:hypothetical protein